MKTAFIITTFLRENLLKRCLENYTRFLPENCDVIVCDQGKEERESVNGVYVVKLPFDCGLSKARNEGVALAKEGGYDYCVISADSIILNDTIKKLPLIIKTINDCNYDIIGLDLKNRKVGWEGKLNLIPNSHFEINFINKSINYCSLINEGLPVWNCEIVRNFFIAKTDIIYKTKWDENLKAAEHEDMFIRLKKEGTKIGWTNAVNGEYIGERTGDYNQYRQKNWAEGQKYLRNKYNLKSWVKYINLDYAKEK